MKAPLVSVIVPNYNHAPYLRQRFDSIFGQTFQDFEVIILDDCSTDNSREIIEEYRNKPQVSHIVYNETNSGSPFKQWAKGFELAKGEYIWIAESDDWAELNFLETLIAHLNTDKSLSVAFCNSIWEYHNKSSIGTLFSQSQLFNGFSFIKSYLCWDNAICNASSALFKKSIISNIQPDYQNFFGSGDYLFWIYICEQGNVYFENNSLNHFRQHVNSTTEQNKKSAGIFLENLKIHDYLQANGYMSFFRKHSSIASYIKRIKKDFSFAPNKAALIKAQKDWSSRTFSIHFSFFISSAGLWMWNIIQKIKRCNH